MPAPDASSVIAPGRVLAGRYNLLAPLARGGMAEVWEARDEVLGRRVAVKLLQAHLAEDGVFVERFRREAVAAAGLSSPNIVATYDTGVDDGLPYIVMELVRGRTLRQLVSGSGPLDPGLAVAIAAQIAAALADAHRADIVHRDIKPANVLVCDDEDGGLRVKVTDFGIAKARAGVGADLTQAGMVLGTPKYLSPEQIEGRGDVDTRADLYSLGVVLFEMLTGEVPFRGSSEMATALAHLREEAPSVSSRRPGIEPALDALVACLLAKSPADRPPTATAARQALQGVAPSRPARRPAVPPSATGPLPRGDVPAPGSRHGAAPGSQTDVGRPARIGPASPGGRPRSTGLGRGGGAPAGGGDPGGTRPAGEGTPPPGGARGAPGGARGGPGPRREGRERPRSSPSRSSSRRGRRRSGRAAGTVVAAVAVAGVVVAGLLLSGRHHGAGARGDGPVPVRAVGASVYLDTSAGTLDHPNQADNVVDGNSSVGWSTVGYTNRSFGDLYPGEGLAIHLAASHRLASLVVTSPVAGWSARAYVSDGGHPSRTPVAAWGRPTGSVTSAASKVTISLGRRTGDWVLLWLTYLGPTRSATISKVTVEAVS